MCSTRLELSFGFVSSPSVGLEDLLEVRIGRHGVRTQGSLDGRENLQEGDLLLQESGHRNLVGGIEHRRGRASLTQDLIRQAECREPHGVRVMKRQPGDFG